MLGITFVLTDGSGEWRSIPVKERKEEGVDAEETKEGNERGGK